MKEENKKPIKNKQDDNTVEVIVIQPFFDLAENKDRQVGDKYTTDKERANLLKSLSFVK